MIIPTLCHAQLGIGGGFEYGMPIFVGKHSLSKTPRTGASATLILAPRDSRLFPSFTYLWRSIVVPVDNNLSPGLTTPATDQHFVLNLNYRTTPAASYGLYFVGVGVAKIKPEPYLTDDQGNSMTLADKEITNFYPVIQVGAKHMHRILGNSSFYLGLEANLKYIHLHPENVYELQQGTSIARATIEGGIIFPGLLVHLDYFFGRIDE